ncbi:MAG: outer membrane receptor for monomeric catechols [Gammaproteobacteria bacterium]
MEPDELRASISGYWLGDLFAKYQLMPRIGLGLNLTNIFDNNYLAPSQVGLLHLHPGTPLTIGGSVDIPF